MSCCCTYTYDLGCVPHCGTLEMTDLVATQNGTHTIEIDAKYAVWKVNITGVIGQPLEANLGLFNEAEQIVFKIKQPDGVYFEYTESPYNYDCFTLKTSVTRDWESS